MKNKKHQSKIKESTYHVKGMHCASCEVLIEKRLIKKQSIKSVEASASRGKVVVFYQGLKPSVDELNQEFKKEGYIFSLLAFESKKQTPFISLTKKGQLLINKNKLFHYFQILSVTFLLIIGFVFLTRSGFAAKVVVSSSSALPAFFLFGLVAGVSSCAALIGGLVLSMSKQWLKLYQEKTSTWQKLQPHLLFNFGRVISFTIFGAFLGAFGSLFQMSLTTSAFLTMGVSMMMIFLALSMLGIKRFQRFQLTPPKFITRFVADETNFQGKYFPFVLGALTIFLPCGFTLTTQGLSLASGSSLQGALMMLFFTLGTLPMLLAIGFSSVKLTAKPHLSGAFLKIAGVMVLFFGAYNFNAQLNVLGLPSLNDLRISAPAKIQASKDGLAPIVNGKQVLKMDAWAYKYEPNSFKVRAGIPVRWEIKNKGVSGCTNAIISKGLFNGQIPLDKDINVKEFTPQKPGKYKFSCWMGMVSGVIDVIGQGGLTGEAVDTLDEEIPSGASGCGGGGCTGGCGGGCGNPGCPYAR